MRAVYKDVIIAAKHWQSVYESDGGYDGIEGCIARAQLSIAVDAAVKDEQGREIAKAFGVPYRLVREAREAYPYEPISLAMTADTSLFEAGIDEAIDHVGDLTGNADADVEPSAVITEEGARYVRQADGSYLCDGSACGEGEACGFAYVNLPEMARVGALDFATYE